MSSQKKLSPENTLAGSVLAGPVNDKQLNTLQQMASELSSHQLAWVSGYLWGVSQNANALTSPVSVGEAVAAAAGQLTIIYASQTGNAKGLAEAIEQKAKAAGINAAVYAADDYKGKQLAKETHVIIVAATNGEGEPPDNALALHEFLQSKKAPKLDNLQYGVIALGDSSYEHFCQTGKDFDAFLAKLGARPFIERIDCDVDYEAPSEQWIEQSLTLLQDAFAAGVSAPVSAVAGVVSAATYDKQHPYSATLLTSQKITGRDSSKDIHHIEIDLQDSGITYQPGDALGVWYQNCAELAKRILKACGLSGVESVDVDGENLSIHTALVDKFEITAANPQLVEKFAELSGSKKLLKLSEDKNKLREYANQTQIIDVLTEKKTKLSAEQLVGLLRRLTPRLYSIASSQTEVEDEVHLTVGVVEYQHGDEARTGGASGYLARQLKEGDSVKVFVEHNANFKLPESDDADVIMIGPGTGVAPFRSFIQERDNRAAAGKNWLFFGERTFTQDFLYQVEWQKYLKSGTLARLDVAFSRDQQEKVYVQQRILEQAADVWEWLKNGAYIYVCGDANHMAKDVNSALITVAEQQGNLSHEEAEAFINDLRKAKRYQRDVY